MRTIALAALPLLAAACSAPLTGPDGGRDAAQPDLTPPPPDFALPLRDPYVHPEQPLLAYQGGRLLGHVDAVTVCWQDDPLCPARADFMAWLVASPYMDLLDEYRVHPGTARGPYYLPNPAPAELDDAAVGPLLRTHLASGALPAPGADTLYVLYLPPDTKSTEHGETGCQEYGGYHFFTATGLQSPQRVAYAIIPTCDTGPGELDSDTAVASHELVEAVTDPEITGWLDPTRPLSEIADLCTPLDYFYLAGTDGASRDWQVSRFYSTRTAAAGDSDPCKPVPGPPYVWFNAGIAPDPIEIVTDADGRGSTVIRIEPFAAGPVGKIYWQFLYGPAPGVNFSAQQGSGIAGSTQEVTISVTPQAQSAVYPIWLATRTGNFDNVWWSVLYIE